MIKLTSLSSAEDLATCSQELTPCAVATSDCSFSAGMPLPLSEIESRCLGKSNLISTAVAPASRLFDMTSIYEFITTSRDGSTDHDYM